MAGWEDLIPKYKEYGGPKHSGSDLRIDPFSGGYDTREFVNKPEDALDWCFFWHDVRYYIAKERIGDAPHICRFAS
jgi:hypothetical protein